ncbi:hypothetical protein FDP41_001557 [Naegleria fowleri]|uniref:Uncharacterized protein n=1 Tax=Naegleria fowleri TaxID=5763 RepID=A0A6A5BY18_NAEFO|nr:uncharacterized protein FDP41_001557 [Naegleria fowleri]KAF0979214.1 hypothetical protein FDP41_001557 [Naegleria fowleri]
MDSPIAISSSTNHDHHDEDNNSTKIGKGSIPVVPFLNTRASLQIPASHSPSLTSSPSTPKEISRIDGERNFRERPSPRRSFSFVWKNHSLNNNKTSNTSSPTTLSHTFQKPNHENQLFDDTEIKKVITMSLQLTEEVKRLKTSLSGRELQNQVLEKENQFLHDELAAFKEKVSGLESKSNKLKYQRDRYHSQLNALTEKYEALKIKTSSPQVVTIGTDNNEDISDDEENVFSNNFTESNSITEEESIYKLPYSNSKTKDKAWITTAELKNNYHNVCDKVDELSAKLERSEKALKESLQQNKLLEIQLENARANEKALLQKVESTEKLYYESCEKLEALNSKSLKKDSVALRHDMSNEVTRNASLEGVATSSNEGENENTEWPSIDRLSDQIDLMSTEMFEGEERSVFLEKENQRLRAQIEELQRILDHTRDDLQLLRIQSTLSSPRTPRLSTPREFERPSSDRSNQSEGVDSKIMDEWTKLLADKFDHNLRILKEQVVKYEKRAHNMNVSHDHLSETSSSLLEDYFRLTLLSVKILLSKEPRYQNTVWYKIWCDIDSEEIYSCVLTNEIPIEEWWLFLFTTVQTRLENAKLDYEEEEERDIEM